jgi:hypothetical protein
MNSPDNSEEQQRQIKIDADIDEVIKTIQGLGLNRVGDVGCGFDGPAQTMSIETATPPNCKTCSYHADFCPDHVRFRDRGYATHAEL